MKCQLLASEFYEALRNELRVCPRADVARRNALITAVNQCDRTAIASANPGAMLQELRDTIDLLQADASPTETRQAGSRPKLRVIEGRLSRT